MSKENPKMTDEKVVQSLKETDQLDPESVGTLAEVINENGVTEVFYNEQGFVVERTDE